MTKVVPKRVAAQIEGDFVVFLIGMRINKPWKVHKWLPRFPSHAEDDPRARAASRVRVPRRNYELQCDRAVLAVI